MPRRVAHAPWLAAAELLGMSLWFSATASASLVQRST
jgi:hypothetical protein